MDTRYFAVIGAQQNHQIIHSWVSGEHRELMPWARVVIIETQGDSAMMFRYAADGTFAGDTWHESIADAYEQAEYEYQGVLSEWRTVPSSVEDTVEFALKAAN